MKLKFLVVFVYLLLATSAFAELSPKTMNMIKKGAARCEQTNNELTYTEYWGDEIPPESLEVVCLADKFAHQAAAEGRPWLKETAPALIDKCREESEKNKNLFYNCLQETLGPSTQYLTAPCAELGAAKMWSERECSHLVSFIFMTGFQKVLKSKMTPTERFESFADQFRGNIWLELFVNPITAILAFLFLIFNVLYLIKNGNWMNVTYVSIFFGPFLFPLCATKGGISIVFSGLYIIVILLAVLWSHSGIKIKFKRKKPAIHKF